MFTKINFIIHKGSGISSTFSRDQTDQIRCNNLVDIQENACAQRTVKAPGFDQGTPVILQAYTDTHTHTYKLTERLRTRAYLPSRFSQSLSLTYFRHLPSSCPGSTDHVKSAKGQESVDQKICERSTSAHQRRRKEGPLSLTLSLSTDNVRLDHHHLIDAAPPKSSQIRWMRIRSVQRIDRAQIGNSSDSLLFAVAPRPIIYSGDVQLRTTSHRLSNSVPGGERAG